MADFTRKASVSGDETVRVEMTLGGPRASWQVLVYHGSALIRSWTGTSWDVAADTVDIDASLLGEGASIQVWLVYFGPGKEKPFHYAISVSQRDGGTWESILSHEISEEGEVAANSTATISGTIAITADEAGI